MTITTASGSKAYISNAVPATTVDTSAEYAALTWVEITEIEDLGEFGDEAAIVTFASLSDARVRKLKGARDAGTMALVVGRDPFDAGQTAARAAERTKFEYGFKIEAADKLDANDTNTIYYFRGLVTSARNNYGANNNVVRTTFNIGINTDIVEVLATVVA